MRQEAISLDDHIELCARPASEEDVDESGDGGKLRWIAGAKGGYSLC
jgi:hypothetical protein